MKIPFIGPHSEEYSTDVDAQTCVNWYVHFTENGKGKAVLYPTPGLTVFSAAGVGEARGSIVFGDYLFSVIGDTLYKIDNAGSATTISTTLNTSAGIVGMAHNGVNNGQQIIIVDGTNGYIYDDTGGTLAVITDVDFPDTATHVIFMEDYFIVNDPSVDGQFAISGYLDGTTWDATEVDKAVRDPDKLQAVAVNRRELWLIGENTSEIWYNSGAEDFPFEPIQSGFIEWGCVAPYSVAKADGSLFWLSQNNEIVRTNGLQAQVVSTKAIENTITQLTSLSDAIGYSYKYAGHTFYVITFPTDTLTLVYDTNTNLWHKWESASVGRHRSNCYALFNGKHIVGDFTNGKLYKLDWSKYTDAGSTITRTRRSAHIHADDTYLFHKSLEIEFESGVGDEVTADPQIMMRWSDDGGHTWSDEDWRSMGLGASGEYWMRAVWRKLGRSKDRIYEIKITDPVKPVIINAYINAYGSSEGTFN